jgi:hypothetical protein
MPSASSSVGILWFWVPAATGNRKHKDENGFANHQPAFFAHFDQALAGAASSAKS